MRPPSPTRILAVSLLAAGLALLLPGAAQARRYSVDVDVVDSDDLRQLYYDGLLDESEFAILIRLIENPIDLNQAEKFDVFQLPEIDVGLADRIVEERVLNGPYTLLADIVNRVEGVDWRLLDRIRPFVYLRLPEGTTPAVRSQVGFVTFKQFRATQPITSDYPARSHSSAQLGYEKWPNIALGAHTDIQGWLDVGLLGTAQEGLWNVTYDPHGQDIHGAYGTPVLRPYAGYARLRRPLGRSRLSVVAGSYQIAFGEGLVMNTIGGRNRSGFAVPGALTVERNERRFRDWDGLFGGAAQLHAPLTGGVSLEVSVFGSLRNHDQYIGYLKNAAGLAYDPAVDNGLDSPRVWVGPQRIAYQTIPNVFRVGLVGGNATFRINRRTHFGITGYAGVIDRTIMDGVEGQNQLLLTRTWPVKNNFGSVGLNGRVGFGLLEVGGEYALMMGDDVGQGLILFVEVEPAWGRFVFSARHYDIKFANPFASAQATPRLIAGLRTRGEQGFRLQAVIEPNKRFTGRATVDVNRSVLLDVWDFETKGSVRGRPLEFLQIEGLGSYTNQNLLVNGRDHIYSGSLSVGDLIEYSLSEDADDASLNRAGERVTLAGGVRLDHKKAGAINLRYTREWTDAGKTFPVRNSDACRTDWLQGHSLRVWGTVKPTKITTIGGSFKVRDSDVAGNKAGASGASDNIGKQGFETYLAVSQQIAQRVTVRLRGGIGRRLPDTPSECDFGDDALQISPVVYEPDAYALRWFGDFFLQLRVKFY